MSSSATMDNARDLEEGRAGSPCPPPRVVTFGSDEKTVSPLDIASPTLTSASTFVPTNGCNSPTNAKDDNGMIPGIKRISTFDRVKSWSGTLTSKMSWKREDEEPDTEMHIRQLETYPDGYPKVACYLDSDDSFMVYRRFGLLHSRLLLHRQDELRRLENKLLAMDQQDAKSPLGRRCLKSWSKDLARQPDEGKETRKELFEKIEENLLGYGTLLKQAQDLVAMNQPADRDHQSVVNFIENDWQFMEADSRFIYEKEDLVTLRSGRENAWLDATVERMLRMFHCKPIVYLFASRATRMKSTDPHIHYFTRSRINLFVTMIIMCIILALLVVPIYILYYLTTDLHSSFSSTESIGVLLVSTLIFSCVLSCFTKAKRHEILAAAAGYCAVLVVFVGNIGNAVNAAAVPGH